MRIHEFSKKYNLSNKEIIDVLNNEFGQNIKSHMSIIADDVLPKLLVYFQVDETVDDDWDEAYDEEERPVRKAKRKKGPKKAKKNKGDRVSNIPIVTEEERESTVFYREDMTVSDLSAQLNKPVTEVIKSLLMLGVVANQNQVLDRDTVELIAAEYGFDVKDEVVTDAIEFEKIVFDDKEEDLSPRPPVVTIMGHVDHGKTTLLDTIRNTRITSTEAGGITQHIGAYQVEYDGKKITFIDTPGHEAFTQMRARGAQVTDITVLVVAADDGVMPQTREAIEHAKAAGVPIIVAINKIDKDTANPERVMQQLSEIGLLPEEWGGDTIYCRISALKNEGIDELLDMILLVSELRELKANYNRLASGTVIEAKLDRGRGPVATLLVQNGTLRVGDSIVVGTTYGRVRAMTNEWGKPLKEATPSTPVEIIGLQSVPQAGDRFMVFADDKEARKIAEARAEKQREKELKPGRALTLDDLFAQIQEGELKELNLIIKADVQGTAEALGAALMKINVEGVKINIIRQAVGAITESDVTLASASHAIIIGFNVRPTGRTRELAKEEGVDIRLHNVIYKVIEEIEAAMKGLLDPVYEEKVIGEAEVRETFKVSRIGTIAGCYVANGVVRRNSLCRVIREGVVIYEGKINSLRRFKDDVREVAQGYECGMTIENFNDIKVGDVIECYIMEEVEQ